MRALISLIFILLVGFAEMVIESPDYYTEPSDSKFSMVNTMNHLRQISKEVHFMGTQENRRVRDYILEELEKLNIATEVFIGTTELSRGSYMRLAKTENIIATIKGREPTKKLILCAHYDSVLSSAGAADDGHAIACILEVARTLVEAKLKNDIVLLLTDGEEMGLLGAQAYVEKYDVSDIGLILNYEARGNSGASIAFEWSDLNGRLVREMKQSTWKPITSSLSYEVYKVLPNDTDYSRFKEKGVPGINHAFIEGFSYYHNPDDTPETINLNSVRHTGENMLRQAHHFGNIDLNNVSGPNASFFNLLGGLIIYPAMWNKFLLALLFLILIINLVLYLNTRGKIKPLLFVLMRKVALLVSSGILGFLLTKLIYLLYPHYQVFYSGQYYNHLWYLIVMAGGVVFLSRFCFGNIELKSNRIDYALAALVLLTLFSVIVYFKMETGSYILLLPALSLGLYLLLAQVKFRVFSKIIDYLPFLFSFVPIALLFVLIKMFFLAFSITGLLVAGVYVALFVLFCVAFFPEIWQRKEIPFLFGTCLMVLALAVAHLKSKPTEKYPLPSSLFFLHDQDVNKQYWVTNDKSTNIGHGNLFSNERSMKLNNPNPNEFLSYELPLKENINSLPRRTDSIGDNELLLTYEEEVYQSRLHIQGGELSELIINGYGVSAKNLVYSKNLIIDIFGITQDSLLLSFDKVNQSDMVKLGVSSRFKMLPDEAPINRQAKRVDGYTSLVKHYSF